MRRMRERLFATAIGLLFALPVFAAVTAEEAKQLGGPNLTLWGAEKAGNKEGTIPEYSGQPTKMHPAFDPKNPGQHPDPWGDKPLFSITAQNYTKYADKLDGSAEMFKRFPSYRMDIYPTHRSWVYPKWVLDNTVKNATSCKAVNNELKLEGCYSGFPFPIPKSGNEMMWNKLLQYEAVWYGGISDNYVLPTSGPAVLQGIVYTLQNLQFYDPNRTTPQPSDMIMWRVRTKNMEPPRTAGGSVVLLDSLDEAGVGRRAYQYIPGQRRVKLAPDLAYDTPSPYSGGAFTMDDNKGFLGALDRFDFKLVGKKEKYIPYNNFMLFDSKTCPGSKVVSTRSFPNPDCVRWELHRVWVVQATLKPGLRHIYKKRMFFWDEDVPGGGVAENYDAGGQLYRVINAVTYPFYDAPGGAGGFGGSGMFMTDLQTGIGGTSGLGGCPQQGCGIGLASPASGNYFSPEAMAGEGIR